ncbi:hypothetical protein BDF20DRAFT_667353 [Mycotypha africana]|uniref:uncharacterized protein n=1 Tax=Mycotypha africana TaxID=64632 RepID=UPI0023012162|nr:uncharacterized protein BDF20DRAFT_667353 [Mycotypha africana]KAI8973702.1 hypothetical protein BDF20DRAFT_667353 [Mycotypha africana]
MDNMTLAYQQSDEDTLASRSSFNGKEVVFKTEEIGKDSFSVHSGSVCTAPLSLSPSATDFNHLWETYASSTANYGIALHPSISSSHHSMMEPMVPEDHYQLFGPSTATLSNMVNMTSNDANSLISEESSVTTTTTSYSSTSSSSIHLFGSNTYAHSDSPPLTKDTPSASVISSHCLSPASYHPSSSLSSLTATLQSHDEAYKLQPHGPTLPGKLSFFLCHQTSTSLPTASTTLRSANTTLLSQHQALSAVLNGDQSGSGTDDPHAAAAAAAAVSGDHHKLAAEHQDIHSIMYHQHLIPANTTLDCISPEHTFLSPPAPASSSCSTTIAQTSHFHSSRLLSVKNHPPPSPNPPPPPPPPPPYETDDGSSSDSDLAHSSKNPSTPLFTKNPTIVRQQLMASRIKKKATLQLKAPGTSSRQKVPSQQKHQSSKKKRPYSEMATKPSDESNNYPGVLLHPCRQQQEEEDNNNNNNDDNDEEKCPRKKKKTTQICPTASTTVLEEAEEFEAAKKTRRTTTSYDSETTFYLKSIFFEVFSQGLAVNTTTHSSSHSSRSVMTSNVHNLTTSKLTKEQRREIHRKTGLPSRNITYWFSNHKRRFAPMLKVYKKCMELNKDLKTYKDFVQYRRKHRLPDQISPLEVLEYEAKYEQPK